MKLSKLPRVGVLWLNWWCFAMLGMAVLLPVHSVSAETAPPTEGPRITISTTEIDLGAVKPVDGHERLVEIQNTGTSTLKIGPIVPLCTCVQVAENSFEVAAGESMELNIRAMLATYPSNEIKGSIRLHTNDPASPDVDIQVRGTILPEYVIEPAEIDFGRLKAGEKVAHSFIVRQAGDAPLVVERVEAPEGLTATVEEIVPAGGVQEDSQRQYRVNLSLSHELTPGSFNGTVTVITNIERLPRAQVKATAMVAGLEISVTPKVLAFGDASPGETLGSFVVEGDELTRVEASADNRGLVLNVVEVKPVRKFRVEVTATQDIPAGTLLRQISLGVGDGLTITTAQVRVFGRIN